VIAAADSTVEQPKPPGRHERQAAPRNQSQKENVASPSETNGDGCDVFSASDHLAFGAA